jgi:hypothetical protein
MIIHTPERTKPNPEKIAAEVCRVTDVWRWVFFAYIAQKFDYQGLETYLYIFGALGYLSFVEWALSAD